MAIHKAKQNTGTTMSVETINMAKWIMAFSPLVLASNPKAMPNALAVLVMCMMVLLAYAVYGNFHLALVSWLSIVRARCAEIARISRYSSEDDCCYYQNCFGFHVTTLRYACVIVKQTLVRG